MNSSKIPQNISNISDTSDASKENAKEEGYSQIHTLERSNVNSSMYTSNFQVTHSFFKKI